jgi:hypothetical protein
MEKWSTGLKAGPEEPSEEVFPVFLGGVDFRDRRG